MLHHAHGPERTCALCQAAPHPEPFAVIAPLPSPQRPILSASSPIAEVNRTLVEVGSSMSFRGPPA